MSRPRLALNVVTVLVVAWAIQVAITTGMFDSSDGQRHPSVSVSGATSSTTASAPTTSTPTTTAAPVTTVPAPAVAPQAMEAPVATDAPPVVPAAARAQPALPSLVARIHDGRTVAVYADLGDAQPVQSLSPETEFDHARVLPVTALASGWVEVLLPTRPNGSDGWVRAADVDVHPATDAILVDRSARTMTWAHDGKVAPSVTVSIGSPSSPTPAGLFFVTDVIPAPAGSAYGEWIVALDGHSETFTEFQGGDARIAIHGTNDPSSIGAAVSAGCVRTPPDALRALATAVPLGTPVLIR